MAADSTRTRGAAAKQPAQGVARDAGEKQTSPGRAENPCALPGPFLIGSDVRRRYGRTVIPTSAMFDLPMRPTSVAAPVARLIVYSPSPGWPRTRMAV